MSVKRVLPLYNATIQKMLYHQKVGAISNTLTKAPVSELTLMDEIKNTHHNLIRELSKSNPDDNLKGFLKTIAIFQIDILASNLLNEQTSFNAKAEWNKVTAAFRKIPKNIGIKDAWVEYSRCISKFTLMQSGIERKAN